MKSHVSKFLRILRSAVAEHLPEGHTAKSDPDVLLIVAVVLLTLFGLVMVYDSSVALGIRDFGDRFYYLKEQAKWLGIGLMAFFAAGAVDYRVWRKLALPMLAVTFVLLIAVFIPGISIKALGARRWINFGLFVLQPAELAKFTMTVYLAAWFTGREKGRLGAFLMLLGMVVGLVVLEPDLGTSIIIVAIAMAMYFFSGAPLHQFALMIPTAAAIVGLLAITSPYRFRRLMTFFNPESDPQGASYHIRQAIIALGSGGLLGAGLGKSRQKYLYLPEANTDSIFAVIGEEVGFVGAVILMAVFLFLVWRGFRIARRVEDPFGRLLALGVSCWVGIQAAMNIAAMVALIPLTGIPLPLVSYGGSNLVTILGALGVLVNISRHARPERV